MEPGITIDLSEPGLTGEEINRRWRAAILAARANRPPPPTQEDIERVRQEHRARRHRIWARREALIAAGVPARWQWVLANAGFSSPDEVRWIPDRSLLRRHGIGKKVLAALRLDYPSAPWPPPAWLFEE